jgi:hypothetical protein
MKIGVDLWKSRLIVSTAFSVPGWQVSEEPKAYRSQNSEGGWGFLARRLRTLNEVSKMFNYIRYSRSHMRLMQTLRLSSQVGTK